MDQQEAQFFIALLSKVKVRLQQEPNKNLIEELNRVINQLRGN